MKSTILKPKTDLQTNVVAKLSKPAQTIKPPDGYLTIEEFKILAHSRLKQLCKNNGLHTETSN